MIFVQIGPIVFFEKNALGMPYGRPTLRQIIQRILQKKIGDCHETGYNPDLNRQIFSNLDDADSTVDKLNNIIGRKLGAEKVGRRTKEQALRVLDFARTEGLYRVKITPSGFYEVVREALDEDKYLRLRKEILLRNDDGL